MQHMELGELEQTRVVPTGVLRVQPIRVTAVLVVVLVAQLHEEAVPAARE